jgi:hypothetical protein
VVTVLSSKETNKGLLKELNVPVAGDSLDFAVVSSERNVEPDDSVASLNEVQILSRNVGQLGSSVEEELHLFQKPRLLEFV